MIIIKKEIRLSELSVGEECEIKEIKTIGEMRRRFQDIGLIQNTRVKCTGVSPDGNLKAYIIRGAVIAIRKDDSKGIIVNKIIRSE